LKKLIWFYAENTPKDAVSTEWLALHFGVMAQTSSNHFTNLGLPAAAARVREACGVKSAAAQAMLALPHVLAIGVGFRNKDRQGLKELCIVCSVERKLPLNELRAGERLPQQVGDFRLDVVETGRLRALSGRQTQRMRPFQPGLSISHKNVTAGTFGCVVQRNGQRLILSNNHVLADCNNARLGDRIVQPGTYDGGKLDKDAVARLVEFVPIVFDEDAGAAAMSARAEPQGCGRTLVREKPGADKKPPEGFNRRGRNRVDAALALPDAPHLIATEITSVGAPRGVAIGALGMAIQKSGRTTGHTTGQIEQIDVTSRIDYDKRTATFTGQLLASAVSASGDSGSAVLDMSGRIVGLLFAGSDRVTLINPIQDVFDALDVELPDA